MAIIKCKMCGGDLNVSEDISVCECEYCGTKQTVPKADDEKKLTLFARAGRLLRACEFDKASGVFETIVADFPDEAEAYWGLVLCKYGIEYVDDPATGKKIPTCHRSSFDSVLDDANFEQACENTDAVARRVFRDEARAIEDLRQAILQVSGKEEPYDVFISYKETYANGERTLDSVIAQDIYKELTDECYRVFFSRISLESKLGTEYEPYIFAALNSAKVMIVVGTDYENFDSVWVKNEWSRFLKLIAKGEKKTLIPVFKNMDAYDMPKEFAKLSAQDMGKVGAMQDLLRGVEKIIGKKVENITAQQAVYFSNETNAKTAAAIKRGNLALEDGEFDKAKEFFEQALTLDAECAEAYLGLALASEQCKDEQAYITSACGVKGEQEMLSIMPDTQRVENAVKTYALKNFLRIDKIRALFDYDLRYPSIAKKQALAAEQEKTRFENNRNINRAFRFAKGVTAERINAFKTQLYEGLDQNVLQAKEREEADRIAKAEAYAKHLDMAEQKASELRQEAEAAREKFYKSTCQKQETATSVLRYQEAIDDFQEVADYKDSAARIAQCETSIRELEKEERLRRETEKKAKAEQAEAERLIKEAEAKAAAEEAERQRIATEKAEEKKKAKQKKIIIIMAAIATLAIAAIILTKVLIPSNKYKKAEMLYENGQYEEAIVAFEEINSYKDSADRLEDAEAAREEAVMIKAYDNALALKNSGDYEAALAIFEELGGYKDSQIIVNEIVHSTEWINICPVGGIVYFGSYEQDNNSSNGKEEIEWIVLAREDNRVLVISRYALDCKQYNTSLVDVTWETCTLRTWLNNTFLNTAFFDEERAIISKVAVSADRNPKYATNPGNSTTEQVFLLSVKEVEKYFHSDEDRKCAPTAYAIAQGARTTDSSIKGDSATCEWWLRSPGDCSSSAVIVGWNSHVATNGKRIDNGGYIYLRGFDVNFVINTVRPAIWLEIG